MKRRIVALVGGTALAAAALTSTAAQGAVTGNTAQRAAVVACEIWLGSVTSAGAHTMADLIATTPPTVPNQWVTDGVFKPGQVRLSARTVLDPKATHFDNYGYVVIGDALYWSSYLPAVGGEIDPATRLLTRIGGGWGRFTFLETSFYETLNGTGRQNAYALRNDGVLFRWTIRNGVWRSAGSYPGFSAVKTMTLISNTPTYDTFLANTRGGALYTIHIPVSSPMKPVVKQVRSRTWQGFEHLVSMKCGAYGTLLLGIDKDTKAGYLYAVGHASGTSTVIQSRGKVPNTFADPVYFRWSPIPADDRANGE